MVGVSGGADSVALLWMLYEKGFRKVVVCHVNHGLRGVESDGDERFVKGLARRMGYVCEVIRADVRGRMARERESLETAARGERLEFFAVMARKHRCRTVLLAHHADDRAETVLWNLLRGSHQLRGMSAEKEIEVGGVKLTVVRPLLERRHAELLEWLVAKGRKWREDASNSEPVAVRNRLRSEVFPLLREIAGRDPVAALLRAARDTEEVDQWAASLLEGERILDPQGRIHLGAFGGLPEFLRRRAMVDFLKGNGVPDISRALLDEAVGLVDKAKAAVVNLPGGGRLRRTGGRLWIDR